MPKDTRTTAAQKNNRYRVQLDLSQHTFDQLDRLQSRLDASSRAAVIKRAINALDWLITIIDEDAEILIKRAGTDEPVSMRFPLLEGVSRE